MSYGLLLLLTFELLVRPEDLYSPLAGLRLYLMTIVLCTVTALPELQRTLSGDSLRLRPVAVCVLGILPATFLSFAVRGQMAAGVDFCGEFAKVILYFLLVISIIDSPERLRGFAGWVGLCTAGVACIALLIDAEMIRVVGVETVMQASIDDSGQRITFPRVVSVGLFNDPNDLCVILAFGAILLVGASASAEGSLARLIWLAPLPLLVYVGYLTKSRGGLLALAGGVGGLILARIGWRRSMPLIAVGVAGMLGGLVVGGDARGTSHERLMLWAHGMGDLFAIKTYIPTGLAPGYYVEEFGLLAHNSYVNAYVEIGLIGGGLFLLAFYNAVLTTCNAVRDPDAAGWSRTVGPFVLAAICCYAVGCYSLTRCYHIPTYLALGLTVAYSSLSKPATDARFLVEGLWWRRSAALAAGGLVFIKLATQFLGQLGV